ncbi:MAG: ABC transporter ATP-binding protein [Candidatus Bathyarchaeia archaeon]
MLEVKGLNVKRGILQVLWDVSLNVKGKEIVALIGPNGSGKTTLMNTIIGFLKPFSGSIIFEGKEILALPPYEIVKLGISLVPEDRKLFTNCTVYENLILGSYGVKTGKMREMLEIVYNLFPILRERRGQLAGTLSGGEQRMLAIARSLMSNPKLLMLDEPSQGLSPKISLEVFKAIRRLKDEYGLGILLSEQNIYRALKLADYAYVLETGKVVLEGSGSELLNNEHIKEAYLGV